MKKHVKNFTMEELEKILIATKPAYTKNVKEKEIIPMNPKRRSKKDNKRKE